MKPVNLLPHEARRRSTGEQPGSAYVVVGVLAAALVMALGYVLVSNQVTSNANEAAVASAEADRLEAQAQRRSAFTDFAQIKQTRLASVSAVAQTRFDWERFMRELSHIMPEGSWLQSSDASVTGDTATTGVVTPGATATAGAPTANLVGCTPDQTDTARMMVRLREMYRVQDVGLNESAVEQLTDAAEDQATVDNCGELYKFDLVVSFSPLPPAREAPRGARSVPASLGGGS